MNNNGKAPSALNVYETVDIIRYNFVICQTWWHVENATTDLVKIFRIKRKIKIKLSNRLKFISRKDELIVLGLLMASGSRAHIQSQYIVCVLARKSILMAVSFENPTYKLTYVFKISILCFFHKFKYLCKYFTITIFTKKVHCCDIPLTFPTYIFAFWDSRTILYNSAIHSRHYPGTYPISPIWVAAAAVVRS